MNLSIINLFVSQSKILAGDVRDCLDPTNVTDPSCVGGLASVASVMRHSKKRGDGPSIFFPYLDRESKFVQMHPEGWGANRLVSYDYFGWTRFSAPVSLFTDENRLESINLLTENFRPVTTNLDLPATSKWAQFLEQIHIDEETGAAFMYLGSQTSMHTTPIVKTMVSGLDYIAHLNKLRGCFPLSNTDNSSSSKRRCLAPIVRFVEDDEKLTEDCLEAALQHPHPPILFYNHFGIEFAPELMNNNQTVVVTCDLRKISHLHFDVNQSGNNWIIEDFTFVVVDPQNLPLEYKDDDYIEDMKYLRTLADEALANDPVVGTSGPMPLTRTIITSNWRMCMGGECPIGNLFTDALRWASDVDFAVINSGGIRGEGWPAGEVRVSDLWSALPFVNHICTGVMSGVSVFKLLNHSTSLATFESTYTRTGDRLLQMSGMKMTYNTLLNGTGSGRLISVAIYDHEQKEYLALERLKLYKFATDNFLCDRADPFPTFFKPESPIFGEIRGTVDKSRPIQDIVGEYLTELGETYDTSIRGSHVNDTEAFEPMAFVQTEESCVLDQFWEDATLTCKPCPGGKYVKFSEDLLFFLITPDTKDFSGRNVLSNRELFNVTLAPKSLPTWLVLKESTKDLIKGSVVLRPGDSIAIDFDIDASTLRKGSIQRPVTFGVVLDGNYPGCLTDLDITFDTAVEVRGEENFNHLGAIRAAGLTLMGLVMLLSILFSVWTYRNQKHRVVRLSQPTFLYIICGGTFIMASSIIPLSIDDGVASQLGCTIACMAVPWLLLSGFALTFSALFAKIWRVHTVMTSAMNLRRTVVRERDAMKIIAAIVTANFLLLLCWTFVDPLKWTREYINDDTTNSRGFCEADGKASIAFLTLLILLDFGALLLVCVEAYKARKLSDDYTESRWIGIACGSWIQLMLVGIPVILLTRSQPVAQYFTISALVFLLCTSSLVLIFVPKIRLMHMPEEERQSQVYQPRTPTNNTNKQPLDKTLELSLKKRIHQLEESLTEQQELKKRNHDLEDLLVKERSRNSGLSTGANFSQTLLESEDEVDGEERPRVSFDSQPRVSFAGNTKEPDYESWVTNPPQESDDQDESQV